MPDIRVFAVVGIYGPHEKDIFSSPIVCVRKIGDEPSLDEVDDSQRSRVLSIDSRLIEEICRKLSRV